MGDNTVFVMRTDVNGIDNDILGVFTSFEKAISEYTKIPWCGTIKSKAYDWDFYNNENPDYAFIDLFCDDDTIYGVSIEKCVIQ